jgi:hypothetical protein
MSVDVKTQPIAQPLNNFAPRMSVDVKAQPVAQVNNNFAPRMSVDISAIRPSEPDSFPLQNSARHRKEDVENFQKQFL